MANRVLGPASVRWRPLGSSSLLQSPLLLGLLAPLTTEFHDSLKRAGLTVYPAPLYFLPLGVDKVLAKPVLFSGRGPYL